MKTMVKHSKSKSAWNIVNTTLGEKYKIASVPYIDTNDSRILTRERLEAFEHAQFISQSFNNKSK